MSFQKGTQSHKFIDGSNPSLSADCKLAVNTAHSTAPGVSALGQG